MGTCSSTKKKNIKKTIENNSKINNSFHSTNVLMNNPIQNKHMKIKNLLKTVNAQKNLHKIRNSEEQNLHIINDSNENLEDKDLLLKSIKSNFFLNSLDDDIILEIIKRMSLCSVPANVTIYKQGTYGYYFYVIKKGECNLYINDKFIGVKKIGDEFGANALLHDSMRSRTVITKTECLLYIIDRNNFKIIIEHINNENFEENKHFIENIPVLSVLDQQQKFILNKNLLKEIYGMNELIVKEGEISSCVYVIKEGEVVCKKGEKIIRNLKEGDYFGERGILIECNRTLDVISNSNKTICYAISIETLKNLMGENFRENLYENFIKASMKKSMYFKQFNVNLINDIFHLFKIRRFNNNDVIYQTGFDITNKIIVVIDGDLKDNIDKRSLSIQRGKILFEEKIFFGISNVLKTNLYSDQDCLLIEADRNEVIKTLGNEFEHILKLSEIINTLKKISIFKNLSDLKLSKISDKIKIKKFEAKNVIIKSGEMGEEFYMVKTGKVDFFDNNNKYIRTLEKNDFFGEKSLLISSPRSATAIAKTYCELYYLIKEDFLKNIEKNMNEFLIQRINLQDTNIELKDLKCIRTLGSGNYGTVCLVKNKNNNVLYSIKAISIKNTVNDNMCSSLLLEKQILLQIDHQFIVKLVKSLKDKKFIYFLEEYINGKDLFDTIREIGLLSKYQNQFYSASLFLTLNFLHTKKIIFRDIKPENIMVCKNGYIKLIDFGAAKIISDQTNTIIGTPHYMAPEVIMGKGYSFQIDIWSVGICMYEFIVGYLPFGEECKDPVDVYKEIVSNDISFPDYINDDLFKSLVVRLLKKNVVDRIVKFDDIKNDEYFNDFDWEGLNGMYLKPAFIPTLNKKESVEEEDYSQFVEKNIHEKNTTGKENNNQNQINFDEWIKNF